MWEKREEEIMGLSLGDIQYLNNGSATALIWGRSITSNKVWPSEGSSGELETNPEKLAATSAETEHRMTLATRRTPRVIDVHYFVGTIHILHYSSAVLPSHVLLEGSRFSLSFPWTESRSIWQYRFMYPWPETFEQDTSNSRAPSGITKDDFPPTVLRSYVLLDNDVNYVGKEKMGESCHSDSLENAIGDMNSMDMTASIQDAMHHSNLEMRYYRIMHFITYITFFLMSFAVWSISLLQ